MIMQEYFDSTVSNIKNKLQIDTEIIMYDHELLNGKHKKAVGCCHKFSDDTYMITIDEYFVTECYEYFILGNKNSSWGLVGETLEQVICHEIAHLTEWRHGKKHTVLMNKLLEKASA
jgi:hypothetical protein